MFFVICEEDSCHRVDKLFKKIDGLIGFGNLSLEQDCDCLQTRETPELFLPLTATIKVTAINSTGFILEKCLLL